jgi:hypothetical protein
MQLLTVGKKKAQLMNYFQFNDTIAYDEGGNSTSLLNALIGVGTVNEYVTIGTRSPLLFH